MSVSKEALHEAGHAVIALSHGFKVTGIDLIPREVPGTGGKIGTAGANINLPTLSSIEGKGESAVLDILVVICAGIASERFLDPSAEMEVDSIESDGRRLLNYAARAIFSSITKDGNSVTELTNERLDALGPVFERAETRAMELVKQHENAIYTLANLLEAKKQLSGGDIESCLEQFRLQ